MTAPLPCTSRAELVQTLRERMRRIEGGQRPWAASLSRSGSPALDRLLPGGGFLRGTIVEWLAEDRGSAAALSMIAARQACREGGALVIVDRDRRFYPPAAASLEIDLADAIVVQPESKRDELWVLDQAIRCEAVAAVWGPIREIDARSFRRLQLAAQRSGCLGLVLRPATVRGRPSWSDVQLLVEPRPSRDGPRFKVQVIRSAGHAAGGAVELEIDETTGAVNEVSLCHETHPVPLAAQLARPATNRRSTGT